MTRFGQKIAVAVLGIGMLIASSAIDAQAGGFRISFGGGRGGISIGHSNHNNQNQSSHNNNHNNHNNHHIGITIGGGYNHRSNYNNAPGWGFYGGNSSYAHSSCGCYGFGYCQPQKGIGFVYVSGGHSYSNPYCSGPIGGYDYTQPIVPAAGAVSGSPLGLSAYRAAREAFLRRDYRTALRSVSVAAREMPNNADVHQFRSLVLFAVGEYRQAAAIAHSAMTSASGWDWPTLRSFYPSAEVYTVQLRALEDAKRVNPNAPELRFLLGYHYLMLGHGQSAYAQLNRTVELQPADQIARQMLKISDAPVAGSQPTGALPTTGGLGALAIAGGANPAAGQTAQPAAPGGQPAQQQPIQTQQPVQTQVPAGRSLVGTWKATPTGGVQITFTLDPAGSFNWQISNNGQTSQFSGQATINGSSLKLVRSQTNETLNGTLRIKGPNSFSIKLNDGKNNPELTFTR